MPPDAEQTTELDSKHALETAFNLFNRLSLRLEEAYGDLEDKVASLNAELRVARREREVQRAEKERIAARLAGLLAELPVGVVLVGEQGLVEEVNQAAREMLDGLEAGACWETVVRDNLVGADDSGDMVSQSRRRITLTRRELASATCVIVLTDVTPIHDLQERVSRNQRLSEMGEMAARLAHQIRTPVSSAMLYASGLTGSATESTRRSAGKILDRLRHLETMVNDMLTFAKGGIGELEQLTAREVICQARRSIDPRIQQFVTLGTAEQTDHVRILVNREILVSALVNLAANAVESGASHVQLDARGSSEGYLELSVADDGPGVAPDIAAKVFDPFFTTRSGGTGLGLAVVRSVAESFGGSVVLESNAAGGATFRIRLPLDSSHVEYPTVLAAGGS